MRADRGTALEAAVLIVLIRASFRLASFAATLRWVGRGWRARDRASADPPDPMIARRVGAAVRAAARRLPGSTCLVEAVAAEAMLKRRGVPSTLHIGVRAPSDATPLDAHAWLECAGSIVVGDQADLIEYRILTRPS